MSLGLGDLGNIDVTFTGEDIGSFTLRGYGPNSVSIMLESIEPDLYKEQVGAYGDLLINKSYKAKNMMLTVNILRHHFFYAKLKKIAALELQQKTVRMTILFKNNNTLETVVATDCFLKNNPSIQEGSDPTGDVEFKFLMPSCVYNAPVINN